MLIGLCSLVAFCSPRELVLIFRGYLIKVRLNETLAKTNGELKRLNVELGEKNEELKRLNEEGLGTHSFPSGILYQYQSAMNFARL